MPSTFVAVQMFLASREVPRRRSCFSNPDTLAQMLARLSSTCMISSSGQSLRRAEMFQMSHSVSLTLLHSVFEVSFSRHVPGVSEALEGTKSHP